MERSMLKSSLTRIGLALAAYILIAQLSALGLMALLEEAWPAFMESPYATVAITIFCFYCLAFPVYWLIIRKAPVPMVCPPYQRPGLGTYLAVITISYALMYVSNLISVILYLPITLLKGGQSSSVVGAMLDSFNWLTLLYFVILAPILEELTFRKILLDRLKGYGEQFAIFVSALAFGLFHCNLQQFFYAMVLGAVFAYVTLRFGSIKYSIGLHMLINFCGSVVAMAVLNSENIGVMFAFIAFVLAMVACGTTLLITNRKKIYFARGAVALGEKEKMGLLFRNPGMIVFFICTLLFICFSIIVS